MKRVEVNPKRGGRRLVRSTPLTRRSTRVLARVAIMTVAAATLAVTATLTSSPDASAATVTPQTTAGTDFWVTFETNYDNGSDLYLFAAGDTATTGTVTAPAIGFSQTYTVTPGTVTQVQLPSDAQDGTNDAVSDYGIHITSAAPVSVYGLNTEQFTTDGFLGLPTNLLGNKYYVESYSSSLQFNSQFSVIGTVDDTTITVTPSQTVGAHTAGVPFTEVLNQGQSYQLGVVGDLTGSLITSDKNVAVFAGSQCTDVPNDSEACNTLTEEMTPVASWGQHFVTAPLATRSSGDIFRVLASEDGTSVSINGTVVATINAGQFFETTLTAASVVTSTKPVHLMQYSQGQSTDDVSADPFDVTVTPDEQFLNSYTVTTEPAGADPAITDNYINIVAPTASTAGITLDGAALPAGTFTAIPGSTFSAAQVHVSFGSHVLKGTLPFGIEVYGFGGYDGYGYPGGFTLSPIVLVHALNLSLAGGGTAPVGSTATGTATATDVGGDPVSGVRVDYTVTGANPSTGFAYTDATGKATFSYIGAAVGTDTVVASVGSIQSSPARFTWVATPSPTPKPTATPTPAPTVTPSPTPSGSSPAVDNVVSVDKPRASLAITTPNRFTTSGGNELLAAYIQVDGPRSPTQKVVSVVGGGLTWTLAARSNATWGTTEVWTAFATKPVSAFISAQFAFSFDSSMTVAAYKNAAHTVGAVGTAAGITGTPSVALTPTKGNSLIWASAHDWTNNTSPVPVAGQAIVHNLNDNRVHDDFWVQSLRGPALPGTAVTVGDTTPSVDRWTVAAVEIPAA